MSALSPTSTHVRSLDYNLHVGGPEHGPPVFLLHGLMDTGASFAPLADHLPDHWRLIAPDWRGHGDTDPAPQGYWFPDYVADLEALVQQFADTQSPVTLIGHSMGGQVASLLAGLRPGRVGHLVCLDSLNVPATPAADIPRRYRAWLDAQVTAPAPRTYDNVDSLAARIRRRYPELQKAQVAHLAQAWSKPTDDGGIRLATDPLHHVPFPLGFHPEEAMAVWREVTAPVLCIDAGESQAARWIDAETMAERRASFNNVEHAVVPDCGHMLHLEQPAAVAERITAFVGN